MMNLLSLKMPVWMPEKKHVEFYLLGIIALLLWYAAPYLFQLPEGNSEEMMTSIGLLLMLALISFLLLLGLCWWLVYRFWVTIGLPCFGTMVLRFNELELWEQLKFAFGLFALLLLAGVGALIAIL